MAKYDNVDYTDSFDSERLRKINYQDLIFRQIERIHRTKGLEKIEKINDFEKLISPLCTRDVVYKKMMANVRNLANNERVGASKGMELPKSAAISIEYKTALRKYHALMDLAYRKGLLTDKLRTYVGD